MAGAPLAFDDSVLSLNGAAAQATAPDVNADDEDGAAEEFVENPNSRVRSEEHTSELQSLMRISYAVFCLKKKNLLHFTSSLLNYLIIFHSLPLHSQSKLIMSYLPE